MNIVLDNKLHDHPQHLHSSGPGAKGNPSVPFLLTAMERFSPFADADLQLSILQDLTFLTLPRRVSHGGPPRLALPTAMKI
jgi:hypothetical protein